MKDLILNTKATIGKVLASENITVRYEKVRTASFDVKNRILRMPIFRSDISPEVLDTFVGHEVGHALWTPLDEEVFSDKKLLPYVNLLEDIRIERMIKAKFPGLVKSFYRGYNELWLNKFFGVTDDDIEDLGFADRLNIHAKLGKDVPFNSEEEGLVTKAKSLQSWGEVVEFAKELRDYCKEEVDDEDGEVGGFSDWDDLNMEEDPDCDSCSSSSGEEGQECENDVDSNRRQNTPNGGVDDVKDLLDEYNKLKAEEDESIDDETDDSSMDEGMDEQDGDSEDKEEDKEEDGDEGGVESLGASHSFAENKESSYTDKNLEKPDPEIITQKNFESATNDLFDGSPASIQYYTLRDPILSDYIISKERVFSDFAIAHSGASPSFIEMKKKEFEKFKRDNLSIVNHMLKEFEMKKAAMQAKKGFTSRSGDLDMNAIYKYRYDDDIFKKIHYIPDGKSHGLILVVDWSGSMAPRIQPTIAQIINLVLFCKKAGIAFDVYAFTDGMRGSWSHYQRIREESLPDELFISGVNLIHFLSSTQRNNVFNTALFHFYLSHSVYTGGYGLNGTPLNNTIMLLPKLVEEFKKTTKSQIVHIVLLTDGAAGDNLFSKNGCGAYESNAILVHKNKYYDIYSRGARSTVENLLNFVKDVVDVKIVGFFLTTYSFNSTKYSIEGLYRRLLSSTELEKMKAEYKDGYATAKNCGYDELYYVKTNTSQYSLNGEDYFEGVDSDDLQSATKGVKAALNKWGKGRNKSRVLMNRFIDLISRPKNIV